MDELIEQFAIEARELTQQASDDLIALEANPEFRRSLESAFRAFHTLKGSVALFDFGPMLEVLHHAEDILSQARAGSVAIDAALVDPLLAVIAWVDDSIEGIVQTGELAEVQAKQASRLLSLLNGELKDSQVQEATPSFIDVPDWALSLRQHLSPEDCTRPVTAIRYEPHPECFFNGDDPLATMSKLPDLLYLALSMRQPPPETQNFDPFRCHMVIEAICGGPRGEIAAQFRLIPDQVELIPLLAETEDPPFPSKDTSLESVGSRQTATMRVDAARIDRLIEIAGELVTAKNGLFPLAQEARNEGNTSLARRIGSSHQEIERLVASLYHAATRARMVALEQTFRRFPRLVRETSTRLGKAVDLVMEGEALEADREIVENLFEPLLHLIRNGLDHGIETEDERLQSSKSPRGTLRLRAIQSGDQIRVELSDDGRGMNASRIRTIAVERGLVSMTRAAMLPDEDVLQFVFAPGFSTSSAVSDLSGRGVGLDVVQRSIQRLGGTLELNSSIGLGTTFILNLPITFSMSQLMVVEVGGERYGLPITDVIETLKLPANTVQSVRSGQAFVLRNRTMPLVYLAELLQLPAPVPSAEIKILILQAGEDRIGIVVDAIAERSETLTRPLTSLLQGVTGISGTTVLGDGKVLLVLNVEELLQ